MWFNAKSLDWRLIEKSNVVMQSSDHYISHIRIYHNLKGILYTWYCSTWNHRNVAIICNDQIAISNQKRTPPPPKQNDNFHRKVFPPNLQQTVKSFCPSHVVALQSATLLEDVAKAGARSIILLQDTLPCFSILICILQVFKTKCLRVAVAICIYI